MSIRSPIGLAPDTRVGLLIPNDHLAGIARRAENRDELFQVGGDRAGMSRAEGWTMELVIRRSEGLGIASQEVEVVERKGLGHPDSLCDALAEQFSGALCRFNLDRFGLVLHHNVDKALLWAGASRPAFGGGAVLQPIEIFLAGRATQEFQGVAIPVEVLARACCHDWLGEHLHALDADRHVRIRCLVRPASSDLVDLYLRQQRSGVRLANDTSIGVGYAPLSELERVVAGVEAELNGPQMKQAYPELGEDIKIMGVRRREAVTLTLACAFVDRFVTSLEDYLDKRSRLAVLAGDAASRILGREVSVEVNTADDPGSGHLYLTVTGTSAEAGDDGEVGRGNRANGLITPYRPMSLEAVAGKNPITHVGKLYNLVATRISSAIIEASPEVASARCVLVSQIGRPVRDPRLVDVEVQAPAAWPLIEMRPRIEGLIHDHLGRLDAMWRAKATGTEDAACP
jgi:S-adenosylmethionine synthetase